MEHLGLLLDRNVTSKYSPVFEIIDSIEIFLIIAGTVLCVPLIWIIWNAKPLHRNLRIILVACIVQCTVIFITRSALIFAQYCASFVGAPFLMTFAVARIQSFVFFSIIMTGITAERVVATFYWAWYERQWTSTLAVVCGILGASAAFAAWNTLQIVGVYRTDSIFAMRSVGSPLAAGIAFLSCCVYVLLLAFNKYELRRRLRSASNSYSLARTYQLRENVVMMGMILRIMGPAFVISSPAFVFRAFNLFLPHTSNFAFARCFCSAMFDLWITLVSALLIFGFPLFNYRFRKPASRIFVYRLILSCFYRRRAAREISKVSVEMDKADIHFESLNRALRKP